MHQIHSNERFINANIIITIIIMGFESVSASEDVIGNFLRPGLSSIYEIGGNPGRRGKEKVGALAGSVISMQPLH